MAIAFDAVSLGNGASVNSLTIAHTCAGSNLVLVVDVRVSDLTTTVTGITYNGVALTKIDSQTAPAGRSIEKWYLINPATGANNCVISLSASPGSVRGDVRSYTDVHQTTAIGTPAKASGTSTAPTVNVTSATDERVVDGIAHANNTTQTVGAGQTQRGSQTGMATSEEAGAASVTMSWTLAGSEDWAIIAVALKPAAAASFDPSTALLPAQLGIQNPIQPTQVVAL